MAFRPFCKGRALPLCTCIGLRVRSQLQQYMCFSECAFTYMSVLGLLHNNMDALDAFSSIKPKMFGVQFGFVVARWRTF